jgi:hypothetical protein
VKSTLTVGRPARLFLGHHLADGLHGLDDIGAAALGDVQGYGGLAVEAADEGRLLEGAAHIADVADGDQPVAALLDRQAQDVFRPLHDARHLDRELAGAGAQVAGGHELVVAADDGGEFVGGDVVGLHPQRIDGDLQDLFAAAALEGFLDARRTFQPLLQVAGYAGELALGSLAGQHDADDRLVGETLLLDDRLIGVGREPAAGQVDLGADVGQRLILRETGLELERHDRHVLAGDRVHVLDALDGLELDLQRLHKQALGVFRADAGKGTITEI